MPHVKLQPNREDLSLIGDTTRQSRSVDMKDKTLTEFEDLSRHGLLSVSAMDSFLGGLVNVVKDESSDTFSLKPDIDSEDLVTFVQAMAEELKSTASLLSSLHVNIILARRDALLNNSKVVTNPTCRAALRGVPIHPKALFGNGHVSATIKSVGEQKRDLAFASSQASKSRSSSLQSKGRGGSSHHRSQSVPSSYKRGGKSGGGTSFKKPYERKPSSKAPSKPSPQ